MNPLDLLALTHGTLPLAFFTSSLSHEECFRLGGVRANHEMTMYWGDPTDEAALADYERRSLSPRCGNIAPEGDLCTLPKGHPGGHRYWRG